MVICDTIAVENDRGLVLVPRHTRICVQRPYPFPGLECQTFGDLVKAIMRMLGLYGTATGTTPSGLALVRMVDPRLQSGAAENLGDAGILRGFLREPLTPDMSGIVK